jgi:hypothetical protein
MIETSQSTRLLISYLTSIGRPLVIVMPPPHYRRHFGMYLLIAISNSLDL